MKCCPSDLQSGPWTFSRAATVATHIHTSKVRSFDPSYTSHGLARFGREATHSSSLVSMPTRLKPDWCLLFAGFVSSTACPAVRILLAPHASQQHQRPSSARELHTVLYWQAAGVGEGAGTHGLAMAVPVVPPGPEQQVLPGVHAGGQPGSRVRLLARPAAPTASLSSQQPFAPSALLQFLAGSRNLDHCTSVCPVNFVPLDGTKVQPFFSIIFVKRSFLCETGTK